jgi:hypothetical protein
MTNEKVGAVQAVEGEGEAHKYAVEGEGEEVEIWKEEAEEVEMVKEVVAEELDVGEGEVAVAGEDEIVRRARVDNVSFDLLSL